MIFQIINQRNETKITNLAPREIHGHNFRLNLFISKSLFKHFIFTFIIHFFLDRMARLYPKLPHDLVLNQKIFAFRNYLNEMDLSKFI